MSARRPARARDAVTDAEPVYWLVIRLLDLFVRAAFRLSIVGGDAVPRTGPALLAANHLSRMDPVVLIVALHRLRRRVRFLAVEEVFHHPVAGRLVRAGHHVPVGRGSGLRALRAAGERLDDGDLVLVYPEGTIGSADTAGHPKLGVGLLAARHGVPTVPVGVWGVQPAPAARRLRPRRPAAVVIGRPLPPPPDDRSTGRAGYERHAAAVAAAIGRLVPAARRRVAVMVDGPARG